MIEGLHVDVPGTELKTMLGKRLEYHQEKVVAYEKQLGNAKEQRDRLKALEADFADKAEEIGKFQNSSSVRDPVPELENKIRSHKDQCVYYKFMAEHTVVAETYRLAESDLVRLGISGR